MKKRTEPAVDRRVLHGIPGSTCVAGALESNKTENTALGVLSVPNVALLPLLSCGWLPRDIGVKHAAVLAERRSETFPGCAAGEVADVSDWWWSRVRCAVKCDGMQMEADHSLDEKQTEDDEV